MILILEKFMVAGKGVPNLVRKGLCIKNNNYDCKEYI